MRRSRISASTSSERASSSNVIVGFEDSQPVIESLELPFHVCGDGVELVVGELGAGVEVDGALAAKLCGIAGVDERGALGFRDGAGLDVIGLREELVRRVRRGSIRKRDTSDQTGVLQDVSPLMEAPMHLPENGPRWAMEPLQR